MTGFEPWTSGIGSDHSTNWATTTSLYIVVIFNVVISSRLEKEGGYLEEIVETFRGPVLVAWRGSRTNPAIITYHDLGLNHVSNFQVFSYQIQGTS